MKEKKEASNQEKPQAKRKSFELTISLKTYIFNIGLKVTESSFQKRFLIAFLLAIPFGMIVSFAFDFLVNVLNFAPLGHSWASYRTFSPLVGIVVSWAIFLRPSKKVSPPNALTSKNLELVTKYLSSVPREERQLLLMSALRHDMQDNAEAENKKKEEQ